MNPEPPSRWFKSTFSMDGSCVEVQRLSSSMLVRDSKDPAGAVLSFSRAEWQAFVDGARQGEFDMDAD